MTFVYPRNFDVIVVGGGHAGIEASLAASRMGCKTLLLTMNCDTIGQMSCNPAIGGLAKGHLVREVDALGGEMGKTADKTGIQFRMLNTRKGPSVRAPRAQCDKKSYQFRMKWICERESNLLIQQAQTTELLHKNNVVTGVRTALDVEYHATCVVVTTGTFLTGMMHIGQKQQGGGRSGETAALGMSSSLRQVGLELGRLKTGTPPRILKRSIDFSRLDVQSGDEPAPFFSFWKDELFHVEHHAPPKTHQTPNNENKEPQEPSDSLLLRQYDHSHHTSILERIGAQLPCYLTHTNERTAKVIRENLHKSPMYSGVIEGIGPRYCPSIEDKIVRFAEKQSHQIFLEPEGVETDEIYVNGLSTCLPFDVQMQILRTLDGCAAAEILRPAYAVEYDFSFPTQIYSNLETKVCRNLFLAGQINGTSGYEEAAAQGLMAGINAALRCKAKEPFILRRDQAYIGVLIDDLVTKGTSEPYRMFTSQAEHRLILRQDNADLRLSEYGYKLGLLPAPCYRRVLEKKSLIEAELLRLRSTRYGSVTLAQLLKRPENTYYTLPQSKCNLSQDVITQLEIELKYEGYIRRETEEVTKFKAMEQKTIPVSVDYLAIPSLRSEARQKLSEQRPETIGKASRIPGITPSDIGIILIWMKRGILKSRSE